MTIASVSNGTRKEKDWTDAIPDNDHVRFFKTTDWAATPIGPLDGWGSALRLYTFQVLSDSRPACVYWGPGRIAIYNEAFVPVAGLAHPALMGSRFDTAFPEVASIFCPMFDMAEQTKKAVEVVEIPLMVERSGFLEESFFTGNFNPIREDTGRVGGFYNAVMEITRQTITDRRTKMLESISRLTKNYTSETIGQHVIDCLEANALDVPFAMLYQLDIESALTHTSTPDRLTLRGSIGVPESHPLHVKQGYIGDKHGIFPFLQDAAQDTATISPGKQFDNLDWQGFKEPSKQISISPLYNSGTLYGYLVMGSNPRRPLDADSDRLVKALSSTVANIIAFVHHSQKLATSERHIHYLAEHLDIGLEHLSMDGHVLWGNKYYYDLIDESPTPEFFQRKLPFKDNVLEEDQPILHAAFKAVVEEGVKCHTVAFRMKKFFTPPLGPPVRSTLLISAFAYREDDKIVSIMASMTDVSRLVWAEEWQARAAHEAQEAKRQQSEFTDAISHEVRNPLSAIMQLGDSIRCSLDDLEKQGPTSIEEAKRVLQSNVESAQTIIMCAKHQKRIVDDVLTLSKLDFMSMKLFPKPWTPADLVDSSLKILDADLTAADISLKTLRHQSLGDLNVDWVLCDSLRITQIIINLLSNAIKFTKGENHRQIILEYGVSQSNPRSLFSNDILWVSSKQETSDVTLDHEWGTGEQLFLTYRVTDTGPGMLPDECRHLFNKFQQSSPKTSIKYGGTGLGLFISSTLVEKQSGSIGLHSQHGVGSTFAFYVKVRRSNLHRHQASEALVEATRQLQLEETARPSTNGTNGFAAVAKPKQVNGTRNTGYSVLLVEDNIVNQRILQKQLTKAGCTVIVANHGLEALDALHKTNLWRGQESTGTHIDVVLMDWEMPVMDGLTACRKIRALQVSGEIVKHVEVIAVTANVRAEQLEKAIAAGVDAIMGKPFLVRELLETIGKRLGR